MEWVAFLSTGDLLNDLFSRGSSGVLGNEPVSPALQADSLPTETSVLLGKPNLSVRDELCSSFDYWEFLSISPFDIFPSIKKLSTSLISGTTR